MGIKQVPLSLVTGTRNRTRQFARLVESIIAHTPTPWELVVSDASDYPLELDVPANVRILPERPRLGCTRGYNRAFREARGNWVIWLNDDVEVCEGYATAAIRFMEMHPYIGLGALYYSEPENSKPFHVNSAWGCTYANFGIISRDLGNTVGWFDEEILMYGNDNSLTLRVLLAGFGVAAIPDAKVIHHSERDAEREQNENRTQRMRDNDVLQRKYMPQQRQWQATYQRFRVDTDSGAWAHGRRPVSA